VRIIKEKKRRRGVSWILWLLVGMILVVVLCCLLVWLDYVDVPEIIRERLPDPIGGIVDAVEDDREPEDPGDGGINIPGEVEQPQQPIDEPSEACNEDINFIIAADQFDAPILFGRDAIGRFRSTEPFASEFYDLYITQYDITTGPIPCATRRLSDGRYEIYTEEYIQFDGGAWMTLVFKPRGEDCVVDSRQLLRTCNSGSFYHANWPYNNGCCTYGCWCDHPSTGQPGCWQECAPQCLN
jgi:hypothetical protein